ncbi:MAG: DUF5666 domain-containing protein [Pseudomonadota bacterium]
MKHKQLINAMTIILATSGLVACGGGGDSTTDTATASKTTVGTITGFGSVYVNGVKFETDSASYEVDDDANTGQSDLAVGMKVKVKGTINDDGVTGTADSIYYDDDVEGPIDNFQLHADGVTATFTVLGMDVLAEDKVTVFDDEGDSDSLSFATLDNGINVEVSGYFDGVQIVATRIEKQDNDDQEFEIKGTVFSYENSEIVLTLQNDVQSPAYPVADSVNTDITVGQFVEAKLSDTGSGLEVIEIELDDDDLLDDNEDEVELYGILSGNDNDGFMVNEVPLDLSGSPEYEPDSLEGNLVEGMQVEVEGSMVDGILIVDEIEAEAESEIEIEARVTQVVELGTDGRYTITLDMNGTDTLPVISDNNTLLEDDSDFDTDGDGSFTLLELSDTDFVEVEAYQSGTDLIATKIKRKDASDETTLEAPFDSYEPNASITLSAGINITYMLDTSTEYQVDDVTSDHDSFFIEVTTGDLVKIKDKYIDGTADQVEFDTTSD